MTVGFETIYNRELCCAAPSVDEYKRLKSNDQLTALYYTKSVIDGTASHNNVNYVVHSRVMIVLKKYDRWSK